MATNNAVTISAGLINSAATPSVGSAAVSFLQAFTEGHMSQESYVDVAATPTALNASLGGAGYLLVINQSVQAVSLLIGETAMGVLQAAATAGGIGGMALIPLSSGVIVNATVPGTTGQVYVAAVRVSANV